MKYASLRTKKGIIELELALENNRVSHIKITGDFFIYPEEALEKLEQKIIGISNDQKELEKIINQFYTENDISTPGITQDDWINAIMKALTS